MRMDRYNQDPEKASKHDKAPAVKNKHTGLKVTVLVILVLILGTAGYCGYTYKTTMDSLSVSFTEDAPALEVGSDVQAMDFVKASYGIVTPSEETLDTSEIGEKSTTFIASKDLFGGLVTTQQEFTLNYSVVDTEAPVVLWNGTGSVIERGSEFDINKYFGYGDNADPTPELQIDGKVDTSITGKYPLTLTITDESGNETDAEMTIEVADSVPTYSYDPELTSFEDFVSANTGDGRSFGIDVSTWQGDIDFNKVKSSGCDFVIIRIGYSVDGEVSMDSKFEQNYKNAKAAGLKIGLYLYSYDNTEEEVRKSADWVAETLAGDTLDLPIAFDWEDFGEFQLFEMSFTQLNSYYEAFSDELSSKGYETMLYGSKNFLEKVWSDKSKNGDENHPVWLAHYTDETDYEGSYNIWQASQTGKIDGIDGAVDMNVMYENN